MAEVPFDLLEAVSELLASLVRRDLPDRLVWVRQYGPHGATLVSQPEDIWTHQRTEATRAADGGWHLALPLWTTEEARAT